MNTNDEASADTATVGAEDTTIPPKVKPRQRHPRKVSPKVLIYVTDDIIETALPKNSEHCMVADAVKAAFPTAQSVSVDLATVRFSDPAKGLRYIYLTPRIAQEALIDFDEGRRPQPFGCELNRAAQIVSMSKRPKGMNATRVHKLGKRLQKEGSYGVPTIIGGQSLPVMREPLPMEEISPPAIEETSPPSTEETSPPSLAVKPPPRNGRKRRRREFGIRGYKSGQNILISGTA